MSRMARKKSESGIYHIMLRGINRQQIFEDDEDRQRFLQTLLTYKAQCGYTIYAYCLMGNHIHLLLNEGKEEVSLVLKRIAGSYVYWYNWKYCRSGPLFQDRYKSEPVEDDAYFLMVLRYIHQNPVKAGICQRAEDHAYSSMQEYMSEGKLVDTAFALSMLSKEEFTEYHREENTDHCLEIEEHFRKTDDEAKKIIKKISKCRTAAEFQQLDKAKRDLYIYKLHENGLSVRQISRLTGVSKKIVETRI